MGKRRAAVTTFPGVGWQIAKQVIAVDLDKPDVAGEGFYYRACVKDTDGSVSLVPERSHDRNGDVRDVTITGTVGDGDTLRINTTDYTVRVAGDDIHIVEKETSIEHVLLEGASLNRVLDIFAELVKRREEVYRVRLWVDDGIKIKTNEAMWTEPIGEVITEEY